MSSCQVGILSYFAVFARLAGNPDQGGQDNEGAKDNFRRESWKHSGCNHGAHRQQDKCLHALPSSWNFRFSSYVYCHSRN